MPKETIVFEIKPDGTVTERTEGLKGEACERVTAPIEQALGRVLSREATPERYEQPDAGQQASEQGAG